MNEFLALVTGPMLESYISVLFLGILYGFFVGLIPVAGATTGLCVKI